MMESQENQKLTKERDHLREILLDHVAKLDSNLTELKARIRAADGSTTLQVVTQGEAEDHEREG